MNQIDQIKELQRQGYGPKEIAARLRIDRKTTAQVHAQGRLQPRGGAQREASKLDPWKAQIEQWLEEDRRTRFKQRHTAKRIHHRLLEEHPSEYDCSYPLVQRYLKQRKSGAQGVRGIPGTGLGPRGSAGGLRGSRPHRGWRASNGEVPHTELPLQQRRLPAGLRGRDRRVCRPGAEGYLSTHRRGAESDRLRQRQRRRATDS